MTPRSDAQTLFFIHVSFEHEMTNGGRDVATSFIQAVFNLALM